MTLFDCYCLYLVTNTRLYEIFSEMNMSGEQSDAAFQINFIIVYLILMDASQASEPIHLQKYNEKVKNSQKEKGGMGICV